MVGEREEGREDVEECYKIRKNVCRERRRGKFIKKDCRSE